MEPRELAVDVAYSLERIAAVACVFALDERAHGDAYRFAVEMRPFSVFGVTSAHGAVLDATDYDITGRILYFASELRPPFVVQEGARVHIRDGERFAAMRRAQIRATDPQRARRREREVERMREALARWDQEQRIARSIAASLVTGYLEIVADPFPSPKLPVRRVLVAEAGDATAEALAALGPAVRVVHVRDGWSAVDRIAADAFDLVLCGLGLDDLLAKDVYRLAVAARPEVASRIRFVASPTTLSALPPASTRQRVLASPVDPDTLRALLW